MKTRHKEMSENVTVKLNLFIDGFNKGKEVEFAIFEKVNLVK